MHSRTACSRGLRPTFAAKPCTLGIVPRSRATGVTDRVRKVDLLIDEQCTYASERHLRRLRAIGVPPFPLVDAGCETSAKGIAMPSIGQVIPRSARSCAQMCASGIDVAVKTPVLGAIDVTRESSVLGRDRIRK